MISLKGVTKAFHENTVINNVTLEFETGKKYALIGPNGVGKTTLINLLSNVLLPDKGTILLDEQPLGYRYNANRNIYVILAGDRGLHWRLSARQNIIYFLSLKGFGKRESLAAINKNMLQFHFTELLNKRVEEMSFGQKKKVMLFIGFISNVKILIIDEITEGLDIDSREELKKILDLFTNSGKIVIFTTHDLAFASEIADRVIFVNKERISEPMDMEDCNDLLKTYYEKKQGEENDEVFQLLGK